MKVGVIGVDHPHVLAMVGGLHQAGAEVVSFAVTRGEGLVAALESTVPSARRVPDVEAVLDHDAIGLVVVASVANQRAGHAQAAMRAGKHVLSDKPGVVLAEDLASVRATAAETGRRYGILFSERFANPAVTAAVDIVRSGRIGRVVHFVGLGPHRLHKDLRPRWFFDPARAGGILADLATHQIDQFLTFAGAADAEVVMASVANHNVADHPEFQDFGEASFRAGSATGYTRVDFLTPDGLSTWGDVRTFVVGTAGYLEVRANVDVAGREGEAHLFVVDAKGAEHQGFEGTPLRWADDLLADLEQDEGGGERFASTGHCLTVSELALAAQAMADDR